MSIENKIYINFLDKLEKKILEKEFNESLKKVIEIDNKHYKKQLDKETLINIINEYREKKLENSNSNIVQVLLLGNPEVVFRLGIEAVRQQTSMTIVIDDFCFAQNTFLIEVIKLIFKDCNIKLQINLENLLTTKQILENNSKVNKTVCIGDSNRYNELVEKIENLQFYPYNIFEVYSDSDELEELQEKIYDFAMTNGFEVEIYNTDVDFDDVIEMINMDGYGFCGVLLSKDKEKINKFKEKIYCDYIVVNENPFTKTKFELEI